ncbi:MAG: hypothetical protein MJ085_02835 [Clostridia bacterium]|nr:hypothetical protein [Clostridia bacterium]
MKRMVIALAIALVVIIVLGAVLHGFFKDYLVKGDSLLSGIDLERFVNDMANKFVEKLYENISYPLMNLK